MLNDNNCHCEKSVRIRSFTYPYFPAFGLNTDQKNSEYGHFSHSVSLIICYNFVNPFRPMLLYCRNQSSDLQSKSLYWVPHNSNTGLKSVKLNSAKNVMTHMLFVCYETC